MTKSCQIAILAVAAVLVAFTTSAGEQAPQSTVALSGNGATNYFDPVGGGLPKWGNCAPKGMDWQVCVGSCDTPSECEGGSSKCWCVGSGPMVSSAYQSAQAQGLKGNDRVEVLNCEGKKTQVSCAALEHILRQRELQMLERRHGGNAEKAKMTTARERRRPVPAG